MRPDINPKNTAGALPAELLSDDEAPTVPKTPGYATHEGSPPKRRKNRPKKRTRNGAQQTNPKTTPPVGQVPSARPNDARPNATPKTAAATRDPPARRHNPRGVAIAAPRMTVVVKMTVIQPPLSGTRHETTTGREDQIFGKDSGEIGTPAGPPTPTNSLAAPAPTETTETVADTARTS